MLVRGRTPFPFRLLTVGLFLFGLVSHLRAADWKVDEAPVRFTFRLFGYPTHPSTGYLAQIPDGGILPAGALRTHVFTANGQPVESYTLWRGAGAGLWIVLADPGRSNREIDVYVTPTKQPRPWTPQSGLQPSPLLVTEPAAASLETAGQLAALGNLSPRAHVQVKAGIQQAPLSVGGDDSGRPRPTSFYLLAHVETSDPGRTWVAPFFNEGQNRLLIDGTPLVPSKRNDQWGGTGQWLQLAKGLHRVEFRSASTPSGSYFARGFMGHAFLAWKTPRMPATELGARASAGQPQGGAAAWAARVIKEHEIARSGLADLVAVASRDGAPLAVASLQARENFWFEDEQPLPLFQFTALAQGNPDDTTYTWTFGDGIRVTGDKVHWLVDGLREHRVALTAASPRGKSTSTLSFFGYANVKTRLSNPQERQLFHEAMATMLKAYPLDPDPCRAWGAAHWNNLVRTVDYGEGYALLQELLGKRYTTAVEKLSPIDRRTLENIFLDLAPREDPRQALDAARRFRTASTTADRKAELATHEARILLVYLDQTEPARKILTEVVRQGGESAERARILAGDSFLQQGELDKAIQIYGEAQKSVRHRRAGTPQPGEPLLDSWKLGAVKEAAYSQEVNALVEQGNYLEARQALDRWERAFPLSKISEDFILREAELYHALGDNRRAIWMLEPYCRQVDASSYLPEAALVLLNCLTDLKLPRTQIEETVTLLKKRLEFHPVAARLDAYIREPALP